MILDTPIQFGGNPEPGPYLRARPIQSNLFLLFKNYLYE
jgi:hypothetical protein